MERAIWLKRCERVGCGLVNLSTNYVFDGEKGPYAEGDEVHPVNVYGQTKLDSEVVLLNCTLPRHCGANGGIVRFSPVLPTQFCDLGHVIAGGTRGDSRGDRRVDESDFCR